jgi:hypothetical protein
MMLHEVKNTPTSLPTLFLLGAGSRKTIYLLADFMFRFWYRFVLTELSRISMGPGRTVCRELMGIK